MRLGISLPLTFITFPRPALIGSNLNLHKSLLNQDIQMPLIIILPHYLMPITQTRIPIPLIIIHPNSTVHKIGNRKILITAPKHKTTPLNNFIIVIICTYFLWFFVLLGCECTLGNECWWTVVLVRKTELGVVGFEVKRLGADWGCDNG